MSRKIIGLVTSKCCYKVVFLFHCFLVITVPVLDHRQVETLHHLELPDLQASASNHRSTYSDSHSPKYQTLYIFLIKGSVREK